MAINDFKAFAIGGGANVYNQTQFESDGTTISNGYQVGVADPKHVNKVIRQATFVASAIAQIIADGGVDALDNGDSSQFQNALIARLTTLISASTINSLNATKGFMLVRHTKTAGLDGGDAVAGANVRELNTVDVNTITGASLSANRITLPAGTFRVSAVCTSFAVKWSQAYLYNITNDVEISRGMSCNGSLNSDAAPISKENPVEAYIVNASPKVIELRMYAEQSKAGTGLGKSVGDGTEVYAIVKIERIL